MPLLLPFPLAHFLHVRLGRLRHVIAGTHLGIGLNENRHAVDCTRHTVVFYKDLLSSFIDQKLN